MAAQPDDFFTVLPWRQRFGLRRRLRRAWRDGLAEQQADSLTRLRTELLGQPVANIEFRSGLGELTYANGVVVRLWMCHRPAIRALRCAARDGDAVLVEAANHGHCWALYFGTLEGRLPIICRDLRVRNEQGGLSPFVVPSYAPTGNPVLERS
jgi:hypothetical protein